MAGRIGRNVVYCFTKKLVNSMLDKVRFQRSSQLGGVTTVLHIVHARGYIRRMQRFNFNFCTFNSASRYGEHFV